MDGWFHEEYKLVHRYKLTVLMMDRSKSSKNITNVTLAMTAISLSPVMYSWSSSTLSAAVSGPVSVPEVSMLWGSCLLPFSGSWDNDSVARKGAAVNSGSMAGYVVREKFSPRRIGRLIHGPGLRMSHETHPKMGMAVGSQGVP
jgi:hypothetical protein